MEGERKDSIEIRPRKTEWRHKGTDEQRRGRAIRARCPEMKSMKIPSRECQTIEGDEGTHSIC